MDVEDNCNKLEELKALLTLAKDGNCDAKEKIIAKYYGLIIYQSKGIFLNSFTFDDLVQTGIESILRGINAFDINKDISTFSSYIFWCLKNNFNYLCRKEIRNNQNLSLNMVTTDGLESVDFIASDETLEEIVFEALTSKELSFSIRLLDKEESELISFLYLSSSPGKKNHLSDYAKLKNKSYYYCTNLKKRTLSKLKQFMKNSCCI